MSGRKKDEERREPRRSKQEDRKESAQKRGKPSTSELDSLNKLITDQSGQSTTDSRRKRTESSSDSDSKVSRFKTPAKRVRRKIETSFYSDLTKSIVHLQYNGDEHLLLERANHSDQVEKISLHHERNVEETKKKR